MVGLLSLCTKHNLLVLVFWTLLVTEGPVRSTGFVPVPHPVAGIHQQQLVSRRRPMFYEPSSQVDGTGRGKYILAFSLASCLWIFSIPTEFRRAIICPSDACAEQRTLCNDCMTRDEWVGGIKEYYRNGGGVKFDFSIDPKTVTENEQFLRSLQGRRGVTE